MYYVNMAYNLVTRQEWGARAPTKIVPLNLSQVVNFFVHYSGASRSQTVRSIQNYCMDNKGHSDIDYSYLARNADLFVGRGDNIGSHTLGNNSSSYGVCMIGVDGDATDADLRTIRTIYDELCVRVGRKLKAMGHMDAPGLAANYTDCPGSELELWVRAGMPYPEEIMALTPLQEAQINNSEHYLQSIIGMTDAALGISNVTDHNLTVPNKLTAAIREIQAKLAGGDAGITGITEDQLRQIIREEIAKTKLS